MGLVAIAAAAKKPFLFVARCRLVGNDAGLNLWRKGL